MPNIRSSTDLRNNYNDISAFCHETREPVFVTRNGQGDLAVMSIDAYDELTGRKELYRLLDEGHQAVLEGRVQPLEQVMDEVLRRHKEKYGS
jgi:prevent-host-death family protein